MEAWLAAKLGETGAKIAMIVLAVLAVAAILALAYCSGHKNGKKDEVVKEQGRTIKVQQKQATAADNASTARVHDAVVEQKQQQELDNASTGPNDDVVRQQRGCVILRQQGRDTSNIPACRGS